MQWFPILQRIPARVLGLGVRREHVAEDIRDAIPSPRERGEG
jgi:hypothetical protein